MASISEKAFNALLAQSLGRRHPRWEAAAGPAGVFADPAGEPPGVVITPNGGSAEMPVVIETGYGPARAVEADTLARLGAPLVSGRRLEQAVALTAPAGLRTAPRADLEQRVEGCGYRYRLARLSGGGEVSWFPETGWIAGSVDDLAGFCEHLTVSETAVRQAADDMEQTVDAVTGGLAEHAAAETVSGSPGMFEDMAAVLNMAPSVQTAKIGVTMIANALLFQLAVEGDENTETGWRIPGVGASPTRQQVLDVWWEILGINYWPVFYTAHSVLAQIPPEPARGVVLAPLAGMAHRLAGQGAASTSGMAGQMFGKLITDRKFLATFYTRRESAVLLAELAAGRLDVGDWSDRSRVGALRIADLACGTGALLAAAYDRVASRVRRAGGDDEALHPAMMENVLIGADIMPAAAHLTCMALSSTHPRTRYRRSRIDMMPYGMTPGTEPPGDRIRIGSLEFLDETYHQESLLETAGQTVMPAHAGHGADRTVVAHRSADMTIMNPPFTRPTNRAGAGRQGAAVPSFAGMGADRRTQKLMAKRLAEITPRGETAGHGNAGLGSNFLDLAHAKTKRGGVIAFVLPLTVVSGESWAKSRKLLASHYKDICVVSIVSGAAADSAFSADTGMAEALIVATRQGLSDKPADEALWVTLLKRPADTVQAVETANRISALRHDERSSGTLHIGDDKIGVFARASLSKGAGYSRLAEPGLAECGEAMASGGLRLPGIRDVQGAVLADLGALGDRGPLNLDIRGNPPRGPFDIVPTTGWETAEHPMLWAHDAKRETRLVVEPDSRGRTRDGMEAKADKIWATRSRLHFNLNFTLSSQPLAACFTPIPCIGGRAWPTFTLKDRRWETVVLLWANTTPGLVAYWWIAGRQQPGRAVLTITKLPELPVVDPRALTPAQLAEAQKVYDRFENEEFLPAREAYRDDTRIALDEAVLTGILGLGADTAGKQQILASLRTLRGQWCQEPSVRGGQTARPRV